MKYMVVTANSEVLLMQEVNAKLEQGWILQGGVSLGMYVVAGDPGYPESVHCEYGQALVKPELPPTQITVNLNKDIDIREIERIARESVAKVMART